MNIPPFFFLTSGESHGKGLTVIVEGVPAGIEVKEEDFREALRKRRGGFGRGKRMSLEKDEFIVLGGLRGGRTTGGPFSAVIWNTEGDKWVSIMDPFEGRSSSPLTKPRPGHADFSGILKYGHRDIRDVMERSSARETAARVVAGTLAKKFLHIFGMDVLGFVVEIGGIKVKEFPSDWAKLSELVNSSELRVPDPVSEERMKEEILKAEEDGDSLGGTIKVIAKNVPPGLGSYSQWNKRLDARISMALMSIPGIKSVESGIGGIYAKKRGSEVHDEIFLQGISEVKDGWWESYKFFKRKTNNAGGIEGGVSNGEPIEFTAVMKPIPTLKKPLRTIDFSLREEVESFYERSDVCVVPSASFICENMLALVIASSFVEKFGGDSVPEIDRNYRNFLESIRREFCKYS